MSASFYKTTRRRLFGLSRAIAMFGGALMLAAMMVIVSSVASGLFLGSPILGDSEIVELLIGAMVFCFLPYGHFKGANLVIDFFASKLSETAQKIIGLVMELCFTIIAGFLTWRLMAGGVSAYQNSSETMFLQLQQWPVYLFGSIACVFWVITILFTSFEALMRCMGMETETVAPMTDFT